MEINKSDLSRNKYMLKGTLAKNGYDWWWHNFTGYNRKTGASKTFFIEYLVCNPALGGDQPILGQLPLNKSRGIRPSYAMMKAGAWGLNAIQIHNFYPISKLLISDKKLKVQIGSNLLTETQMKGRVSLDKSEATEHPEYMSDDGEICWDLTMRKKIAYHVGYGASRLFRALNVFEMFWHAEGIKTEYSGEVILNGEAYDVIPEKSYGYADKNWGSDFTSPWLWISSCHLESMITGAQLNNSAFEFGGGRPKIFGFPINRKILGGFYYEGRMYDYNFSKFWTGAKVDFMFQEGEDVHVWKIVAQNHNSVMVMDLKCRSNEMLWINYEAPNGKKLHNRLWNGGTGYGIIKLYRKKQGKTMLVDKLKMKNTACEYGEYDSDLS